MLLREVCELVKYPHFKQLLGNNAWKYWHTKN
jgi:hypothetical protein